jgi:hypothetical protein
LKVFNFHYNFHWIHFGNICLYLFTGFLFCQWALLLIIKLYLYVICFPLYCSISILFLLYLSVYFIIIILFLNSFLITIFYYCAIQFIDFKDFQKSAKTIKVRLQIMSWFDSVLKIFVRFADQEYLFFHLIFWTQNNFIKWSYYQLYFLKDIIKCIIFNYF